ncbi:DUF4355 domain-containing protein [uncultured Clostridium sp.]|uniref:DUF4355 domain-containing protein n=1 Tax=uncultured Clostridium sp. TaxID=59620 RepID=UPI0028EA8355|nr:DUF4355 domain-containing protein [uncultured Clostridium sp.]
MEDNTNLNTKQQESSAVDSNKETTNSIATEEAIEKTFTQEELDKIIEKRLTRALQKAEDEKVEAERLAKMSAEERTKAEFEKEKQKFEEERKQYQREKLELQVIKELGTKNLPVEFSKYLLGNDAETCINNIKEFEVQWQNAIKKAVNDKLKGNTPKAGNVGKTINNNTSDFINVIKENQVAR